MSIMNDNNNVINIDVISININENNDIINNTNTSLNYNKERNKSFDLNGTLNLSKINFSNVLLKNTLIFSMTFLSDNRLALGSKLGKIYIFSLDLKDKLIISIPSQNASINQLLLLSSKKLLAISSDKNIYIFNIINDLYELDQTIAVPSIAYKVIEVKDEKLISIHQDNSLRGFTKNSLNFQIECTWVKDYNDDSIFFDNIFSLKNKNKFIATCYTEEKLFFINIGTYNIKNTLSIITSYSINNIQYLNDNYILVGGDLNIYLVDINKEIIKTSIETKGTVMTFLVLNENCFLSGEEDENYEYSNLNKYEIIYDKGIDNNNKEQINLKINLLETKKQIHNNIIRNIVLYQKYALITSGEDNEVKMWNI